MAALAPAQAARALGVDNHPTQWWTRPQPSRWHAGFLRGVGGGGLRAPIPASARRGSDRSTRFRREASASVWSSAPALGARALGARVPTDARTVTLSPSRASGSARARLAAAAAFARAGSGSRRVHCRARRSKIPDDVGFNYDDFDDFVGTGTPDSVKKARKAKKAELEEPSVEWHLEDPPPEPTGPLPDILSFASPMVPGNRIEEAKALQLQRAWARATWAELGEFPDRDSMVGKFSTAQTPWDESPPEIRKMNEEEYGKLLAKYLDTVARAEDTYPEVLKREPRMDPQRLREKFGMRPKVDGKMSYPELMDNLTAGTVGRLLQYDNGNTVIVEMAVPGTELQGPGKKQRFECNIPGDIQWDITKLAYMNKKGRILPEEVGRPDLNRTALSQFMHLETGNEALWAMLPTVAPFPMMLLILAVFGPNAEAESGRKVRRKKPFPGVAWLDKHVFKGKLSKKAPKADMMEEFGKSKAKMIGGKDHEKAGKFQTLTFDDVAGVDDIVAEFRTIIATMRQFKEFQETQKPADNKLKEIWDKEVEKRKKLLDTSALRRGPMDKDWKEKAAARVPKPDEKNFLDPNYRRPRETRFETMDDARREALGVNSITSALKAQDIDKARAKLSIPKGVLFEGPPGTGKTLLAKAVAGEAGVPFFYANGSEFVEMFVGVAAKRVRDLFKRAREVSPSIIFIDEMDTIGRSRALYNNRDSATLEREAGLMQLLIELDGFDTKAGAGQEQEMVLVMGATNLSSQLDPALLRSGRFERSFHIGVPKRHKDRLDILKVHARKLNVSRAGNDKWSEDALLNRTAELTDGYSGASLAALMNEAAILSVRADREEITLADVEKVIERNLVGVSSAPMEDGWGKDHRAMVEAGRAVLWSSKQSMNYCSEVLRVTIKPYGDQMSGVMLMPERSDAGKTTHFTGEERADTLDDFIDGLAMLLAGRCVETVFFGPQGVSVQTKGDLVAAADVAYDIVTASGQYPDQAGGFTPFWPEELIEHFQIPRRDMEAGVYDLMVRAHIRAEEYVNYYKPVILQVASELLAHGSLYGSHVRDLVDDHEVRMKMAKDAELAQAETRAKQEEERLRAEAAQASEEEARREAEARMAEEAARIARTVEDEGVAGAIDVEASEAPLSEDPFGTAAEAELARMEAEEAQARAEAEEAEARAKAEAEEAEARAKAEAEAEAEKARAEAEAEKARAEAEAEKARAEAEAEARAQADAEAEAAAQAAAAAMDQEAYRGKLGRALRTVGLSGDAFMTRNEPDVAEDAAAELPLPGTPPQMFAADAEEAAAMDQADAKRAGSLAKEAGLKAKKAKKEKKQAEDAKAKNEKSDPFGEAAAAMKSAAAQAQAVTDAETAAREAARKRAEDDDSEDKQRLRRALRT